MGGNIARYAAGFGSVATSLALLGYLSISPRPASATPGYATQTRLACGRCHVNAAGGGPNTSFGKAFAANGHKVPQKNASKIGAPAGGAEPALAPAQTADCGYYSAICNPRFGHSPEVSYSSGLSFKMFPQGN